MATQVALDESGVGGLVTEPNPVFIKVGDEYREVPDYLAVVRQDTRDVLGIHGDGYVIEEFSSAFTSLGAAFGPDAKIWESMVLLRKGKIAVGCMRFPEFDRKLVDGSQLLTYIAAYTSHDGSYALTYKDTNVRAECANLLRVVDGERSGRKFRIRHSAKMAELKAEAVHIMAYAQERTDAVAKQAEELIAQKISDAQMKLILSKLIPVNKDASKLSETIAENKRAKVWDIYVNAPDQQGIRGTAWGVVQAFGAYVDHQATYRNTKTTTADESRLIRSLSNNTLADRALELVVAK
jgi:phage/plasmid-like protein (TIGR03299 family)